MIRATLAITALALLAACGDGQPFPDSTTPTDNGATPETDPGIDTGGATPPLPGTANPTPNASIVRFEASAADGSSLIEDVSYNAANDTFTVDGIGFDGANVYTRLPGNLRTIGPARAFGAATFVRDPITGKPIGQLTPYRALYGVSRNRTDDEPRTSYAIVRTGGYQGYGFGGYVYQRNGGVNLPAGGQARFEGKYAGMRVFEGRSGLEYTTGDMVMAIDFEDFNANDAVVGRITNRLIIDESGQPGGTLPNDNWVVQEGSPSISADGEITSDVFSLRPNDQGGFEENETGTFTGIIAGDLTKAPGGEIVGVLVLEGPDPANDAGTVQETGGAVLYRD